MSPMANDPESSLDDLAEHDSNPDTDTDTYNHRYDEEGNDDELEV